jgi:hypothetical protein
MMMSQRFFPREPPRKIRKNGTVVAHHHHIWSSKNQRRVQTKVESTVQQLQWLAQFVVFDSASSRSKRRTLIFPT